MLQQREQDLRARRAHVEHLLRWHQRLDAEEAACVHMEQRLMTSNVAKCLSQPPPTPTESIRSCRQIRAIEKSLEILHRIPDGPSAQEPADYVDVSGAKLNKLWHRLTGGGRSEAADLYSKFVHTQRYRLSKAELADIYEDAKRLVLQRNDADIWRMVLDRSNAATSLGGDNDNDDADNNKQPDDITIETDTVTELVVPSLNLNFSPKSEATSSVGAGVDAAVETVVADNGSSSSQECGFYFSDEPAENGNSNADGTVLIKSNGTDEANNAAKESDVKSSVSDENVRIDSNVMVPSSECCSTEINNDEYSTSFDDCEGTAATDASGSSDNKISEEITELSNKSSSSAECLERRLIDIDDSLKEINDTIKRAPVMEIQQQQQQQSTNESSSTPSSMIGCKEDKSEQTDLSIEEIETSVVYETTENEKSESIRTAMDDAELDFDDEENKENHQMNGSVELVMAGKPITMTTTTTTTVGVAAVKMPAAPLQQQTPFAETNAGLAKIPYKMPDIISEAEVLRRQQLRIEQEVGLFLNGCLIRRILFG